MRRKLCLGCSLVVQGFAFFSLLKFRRKNSLRIHKWTHNEFNIFILGVLTRPLD